MTTSRYLWARIALAFGVTRHAKRVADALFESRLLREAEFVLGSRVWTSVEDIEELSLEYWTLRQLHKRYDELHEIVSGTSDELAEAHRRRSEVLSEELTKISKLEEQYSAVIVKLESHTGQRENVVAKARELRKVYDGMKAKIEVLSDMTPVAQEQIEDTRARMQEIRGDFEKLKLERDDIAEKIRELEQAADKIEEEIEHNKKYQREKASADFQAIGDVNRQISSTKIEFGDLEAKMAEQYMSIGRYVSVNYRSDKFTKHAAARQKSLIEVMGSLQKSIKLNQQLADLT